MSLISKLQLPNALAVTAESVLEGRRISAQQALVLYECNHLSLLGLLATSVKRRLSGDYIFFNRNFHIEPTNICINHCRFCSFRRPQGHKDAWECSIEEMVEKVEAAKNKATEVHIVGGVHPERDLYFYADLLQKIKGFAPHLHIKAFTAVEIDQMCQMAGVTIEVGLRTLAEAGLGSLPGGGAEIFDEDLRAKICPDKTSSERWLAIHETAHQLGIPTNATMLYGLYENYHHRVDHLNRLRTLQDRSGGFNAFIPLKFRKENNDYSSRKESTLIEDLKNYAVSRIFLDNVTHLKAYWPMIGKPSAQLSMLFGVDDLDGTIDDSTRIYSMAGAEEDSPSATSGELIALIRAAGYQPAERDTLYNIIETF